MLALIRCNGPFVTPLIFYRSFPTLSSGPAFREERILFIAGRWKNFLITSYKKSKISGGRERICGIPSCAEISCRLGAKTTPEPVEMMFMPGH